MADAEMKDERARLFQLRWDLLGVGLDRLSLDGNKRSRLIQSSFAGISLLQTPALINHLARSVLTHEELRLDVLIGLMRSVML